MFKNKNNQPINIQNIYQGGSAFLVLNGPSLRQVDTDALSRPGILTIGCNNGPAAFRPNVWIMADDVGNFVRSIWLDPKILKFAPSAKATHTLWDNDAWQKTNTQVQDCPSMVYYERNEIFNPQTWLTEPSLNWGCYSDGCVCGWMPASRYNKLDKTTKQQADMLRKQTGKPHLSTIEPTEGKIRVCPECGQRRMGCRMVIFLTVKLAYALGVRNLYIVGCDFTMSEGHTYAFDQGRAKGAVKNNNNYYIEANKRFNVLQPVFQQAGFNVFNCYEESGLKSFPYMPIDKAIKRATKHMPPPVKDKNGIWLCSENTKGLYERKSVEKQKKKDAEKQKERGTVRTFEEFLKIRKGKS